MLALKYDCEACLLTTKRLPPFAASLKVPSFPFGSSSPAWRCLPPRALCFCGTLALRIRTCFPVRV